MAAKTTRNLIARLGVISLLAITVATTGCGRQVPSLASGNTFTSIDMTNQRPSLPAGVSVLSMTITPNTLEVAVGQPQRFAVELKLSNGESATDPRLVQWSVADSQAGTIDDQGILTPKTPRITTVRAYIQDKVAEARLTIKTAEYSWQQVDSRTTADLFDAKVITSNEAWVVGAQGTILRYYNNTWQSVARVPGDTLRSIDFSGTGNGWIVGHSGEEQSPKDVLVLGYVNGQWQKAPTASVQGALYGVSAVDTRNAWAVGQDANKKILLMKWNGQSWTRDTSYSGKGRLNAVQMLGGSLGWAVGEEGGDAVILRYDGNSWKKDRLPPFFGTLSGSELKGIHMLNSQQGYVVGRKGPMIGFNKGLMLEYDSRGQRDITLSNWKEKDAATSQTKFLDQVPLNDIHMLSGNEGWLLGATITPGTINPNPVLDVYGNLLAFNGTNYRIEDGYYKVNLAREFTGIDVLPLGDGLIVGRQGYVMQRAYDWRQVPVMQEPGQNQNTGTDSDTSLFNN
jgi:photosystem II stability/assembly factor-like uncharacterized protein